VLLTSHLSHTDPAGWVKTIAHLEDGIFSVRQIEGLTAGSSEGSSIPIKMAAVKMTFAEYLIDVHFNGTAYHFRALKEADFVRWLKSLRSSAGFVEADAPVRLFSSWSFLPFHQTCFAPPHRRTFWVPTQKIWGIRVTRPSWLKQTTRTRWSPTKTGTWWSSQRRNTPSSESPRPPLIQTSRPP